MTCQLCRPGNSSYMTSGRGWMAGRVRPVTRNSESALPWLACARQALADLGTVTCLQSITLRLYHLTISILPGHGAIPSRAPGPSASRPGRHSSRAVPLAVRAWPFRRWHCHESPQWPSLTRRVQVQVIPSSSPGSKIRFKMIKLSSLVRV